MTATSIMAAAKCVRKTRQRNPYKYFVTYKIIHEWNESHIQVLGVMENQGAY
jgi:hypothetical protein